jgi:hypothetical protein
MFLFLKTDFVTAKLRRLNLIVIEGNWKRLIRRITNNESRAYGFIE